MPFTPLRILLTNDDGIHAEGLKILEKIAKSISADIWTVAPETEQSGVAHSLTLHTPVRVRRISARKFAISGTPTDCVLLATQTLIPQARKPLALVLSGVNRGSNVGDDITYSGTVAGAMEGVLLDVPSIAISQLFNDDRNVHWQTALVHAPAIIARLMEAGFPPKTLINLNFPDCPPDRVKGVRVARQGQRSMRVALHARVDPKNRPYFWIGGARENEAEPDTDIALLDQGYITLTPIQLDLTHNAALAELRQRFA